ncbi:TetR/AcrR family transcriptional regulator [Phycicoccus sp.]|uniref:TetR/AcrR family transcriptional regulator n=1 Tax=Phycicoccus sp. TaxID=1902410 RepID=UPI002B75D8EF|nr:TetR/AcrR family transcriptional regulator [Phycicoccus sp.]HMM95632.1 TetR/AcrR family transcriptional regulator [Phycicoccus sp.]
MTPRAPAMSPEDRRSAIVDATIPLLREHGVGLTTRQAAEASGIAEGTLFKAFGTKDELVQACVSAVFDSTPAVAELRGIDTSLTLDERLTAGVAVMQRHVERIVGLISVLHHAGAPAPVDAKRRRGSSDPAVDAALTDLIGPDADTLRKPVPEVIALLQLLTLSSVHPLMSTGHLDPAEIVSVVLDGTRHHTDRGIR